MKLFLRSTAQMIVLYYLDNNNEKEIFLCVEY